MAGLSYELKFTNSQSVLDFFSALSISPSQEFELKNRLGEELREQVLQRFINEVDPTGKPWIPSQRVLASGGQTLSDKGKLRSSITWVVNGDSIEVGTNDERAGPLNFGATIRPTSGDYLKFKGAYGFATKKEVVIPPREFLGINENDERGLLDVIEQFILELQQ